MTNAAAPAAPAPPAPSGGRVDVVVKSLAGEVLTAVSLPASCTVLELKERLAQQLGTPAADQKLVAACGELRDGDLAAARARAPAPEAEDRLEVTLVRIPRRTLTASSSTPSTFVANGTGNQRVFRPVPGCPCAGDYAYDSIHHWANHSSGGTYIRLPLSDEGAVRVLEVNAKITAHDQGWGGSNDAGAVVVLLDKDGRELAYSVQGLEGHGHKDLEWTMTPESHGARFEAKKGEEAFGSVCAEGEGLVLELRIFTPDWGGWSVTAISGTLSATVVG